MTLTVFDPRSGCRTTIELPPVTADLAKVAAVEARHTVSPVTAQAKGK